MVCFPIASDLDYFVITSVYSSLIQSVIIFLRKANILFDIQKGFPCGSDGKESVCSAGDLGSISGLERSPGEGNSNPLWYSCLENPHGQRNLVGYSPWGHKKSDMTE